MLNHFRMMSEENTIYVQFANKSEAICNLLSVIIVSLSFELLATFTTQVQ